MLLRLRAGALQILAIVAGIEVIEYYFLRAIGFNRWISKYTSKLNAISKIILGHLLLTAYSMKHILEDKYLKRIERSKM